MGQLRAGVDFKGCLPASKILFQEQTGTPPSPIESSAGLAPAVGAKTFTSALPRNLQPFESLKVAVRRYIAFHLSCLVSNYEWINEGPAEDRLVIKISSPENAKSRHLSAERMYP